MSLSKSSFFSSLFFSFFFFSFCSLDLDLLLSDWRRFFWCDLDLLEQTLEPSYRLGEPLELRDLFLLCDRDLDFDRDLRREDDLPLCLWRDLESDLDLLFFDLALFFLPLVFFFLSDEWDLKITGNVNFNLYCRLGFYPLRSFYRKTQTDTVVKQNH